MSETEKRTETCLVCGHDTPHERYEYDNVADRCEAEVERTGKMCGCSSEDREIASLKATIDALRKQLSERPSVENIDVEKWADTIAMRIWVAPLADSWTVKLIADELRRLIGGGK